tara:strand:+ start:3899 stop:4369 length:471 start_codon:yes stop_codon:yes gene_type:complete
MAGSLNKVLLIGRLGNDPEVRTTQDGRTVVNFSIATSETWKDKNTNERKEKTEWHRVVVFNEGLSKIIQQYVKKGSRIYIEGQLQTRKWQDQSGQDKYTTEIVLQNYSGSMTILDNQNDGTGLNSPPPEQITEPNKTEANNAEDIVADDFDDEIPF